MWCRIFILVESCALFFPFPKTRMSLHVALNARACLSHGASYMSSTQLSSHTVSVTHPFICHWPVPTFAAADCDYHHTPHTPSRCIIMHHPCIAHAKAAITTSACHIHTRGAR